MTDKERRSQLLMGLRNTTETIVALNVTHLIQAVGIDQSERLVMNLAGLVSPIRTPYSSKVKIQRSGTCVVKREEAIEAIERATVNSAKKEIDSRLTSNRP